MTRISLFVLLLAALLTGCGGMNPAPAAAGWFVIPAVEQAADGTLVEWHDFTTLC